MIIFTLILQTIIIAHMLSSGGEGRGFHCLCHGHQVCCLNWSVAVVTVLLIFTGARWVGADRTHNWNHCKIYQHRIIYGISLHSWGISGCFSSTAGICDVLVIWSVFYVSGTKGYHCWRHSDFRCVCLWVSLCVRKILRAPYLKKQWRKFHPIFGEWVSGCVCRV